MANTRIPTHRKPPLPASTHSPANLQQSPRPLLSQHVLPPRHIRASEGDAPMLQPRSGSGSLISLTKHSWTGSDPQLNTQERVRIVVQDACHTKEEARAIQRENIHLLTKLEKVQRTGGILSKVSLIA
jgi:hypothetical protein